MSKNNRNREKLIANHRAFPVPGCNGMTYKQWLVGMLVSANVEETHIISRVNKIIAVLAQDSIKDDIDEAFDKGLKDGANNKPQNKKYKQSTGEMMKSYTDGYTKGSEQRT